MKNTSKLLAIILALTTLLTLAACGGKSSTETYKLGDTVSTDIFEFTLSVAEYTVALENTNGDTYFTAKEYDAEDDKDNPYVAPTGHTYVAFSYTVKNLDRASNEFHNGSFATVKYDGKKYSTIEEGAYFRYEDSTVLNSSGTPKTEYIGWYKNPSRNFLLLTGEKITRRAYIDIDANITDLTESVEIIVEVPTSEGKTESFTYVVTEEDRNNNTKPEIEYTAEIAMSMFTKESAREYFASKMNDYDVVSTDIAKIVKSKRWKVTYIKKNIGYWEGKFMFQDGGLIEDDYGYVNKRTWKVDGDKLIIDNKYTCEMKRIEDTGAYLLVCEGEPYMVMK